MGRVLTIQRTAVPAAERASYVESLRVRRRECASADCRFWAFEEDAKPGEFVEFTEAKNVATLHGVLRGAMEVRAPQPIYNEVELD